MTEGAIDLLSTKLRTPLQVQRYLTLALEAACQIGEKPIFADLVESVLSGQIDDLEPTLTRNGHCLKDLVEQFEAKPPEIKARFGNTLDPTRAAKIARQNIAGRVAHMSTVSCSYGEPEIASNARTARFKCKPLHLVRKAAVLSALWG